MNATLQNILSAVLSVGNAEQNMAYPPHVYENHVNIATSFLLDNLSMVYPGYVDALLPFIKTEIKPVIGGIVTLPDDYRNHLGFSVAINPKGGNCSDMDDAVTFETLKLKSKCRVVPVEIVEKGQWDYRTTSTYAFPTYDRPIGIFNGRTLKVCPYDISHVECMYVKKEKKYRFGYITQPDDTYIYDATTSVESEWGEPAFELLFKAVFSMYGAWSRDTAMVEYGEILKKIGLF